MAFIAMLALASAFATTAMALPENLPTSSTERTWTGEQDEANPSLFIEGEKEPVKCESAKGEGTEEAGKPLGLFHIHFLKCTRLNGTTVETCTGLGEAEKGAILSLGTWHLVWDQLTPELNSAVLFLNNEVHFECTPSGLLVKVLAGTLLCLHLEDMVSSTTHLFHCKQKEGKSEDLHWWNDAGKEETASLKCVAADILTSGCAELALAKVVYTVAVSADL